MPKTQTQTDAARASIDRDGIQADLDQTAALHEGRTTGATTTTGISGRAVIDGCSITEGHGNHELTIRTMATIKQNGAVDG